MPVHPSEPEGAARAAPRRGHLCTPRSSPTAGLRPTDSRGRYSAGCTKTGQSSTRGHGGNGATRMDGEYAVPRQEIGETKCANFTAREGKVFPLTRRGFVGVTTYTRRLRCTGKRDFHGGSRRSNPCGGPTGLSGMSSNRVSRTDLLPLFFLSALEASTIVLVLARRPMQRRSSTARECVDR